MTAARRWACTIAAVAAGCGGHASPGPDAPDTPRERVADHKILRTGEIGEAMLHGGPGDKVVIRLSSPTQVFDVNLHGHVGGATQTVYEELGVGAVDHAFLPSAAGDWFLLVRNGASSPTVDVAVELELYGAMSWSGWL